MLGNVANPDLRSDANEWATPEFSPANDPVNLATANSSLNHVFATGTKLTPRVLTVYSLLANQQLKIPIYQRPYKWTAKNVGQLFDDIATFKRKKAYRLGTVVFHEDGEVLNIVDGQQRTITLLLTVRALIHNRAESLARKDLRDQLLSLKGLMFQPEFTSEVSKANIRANYLEIVRMITRADFDDETVDFLLNRCEVVTFAIGDLSEAFQFFDSQNARGRDLEPHDLLKAYHLREFDNSEENTKAVAVSDWENCESEELSRLFAEYLYRIRNWSRGLPARHFGKKDTALFKGVSPGMGAQYPHLEALRMANHFTDYYHAPNPGAEARGKLRFPFQLDQTILNGKRFFEMIAHYRSEVSRITQISHNLGMRVPITGLESQAEEMIKVINTYPGRNRIGDLYVRGMFDCLLIYYLDKFGDEDVSRAIEKIFIWAYTIRLRMQVVQLATVDNYVLNTGMFQMLRDAVDPREFLLKPLPVVGTRNQSTKTFDIEEIFRKRGYHE